MPGGRWLLEEQRVDAPLMRRNMAKGGKVKKGKK